MDVRTLPERKGKNWARAVTHCVHGHPFTPENTYWNDMGWRACRECKRLDTYRRNKIRRAR